MKQLAISLSIIAVLALGTFFIFKKDAGITSKEADIILYIETGDVSYRFPTDGSFIKATSSPISITTGTQVYTGLGRATILFPNNSSVALDEYTELTVKYEEEKISILQTLGTTYHRVEALVSGGSYEVETPGTLAAVRGTKFAVKYDKKLKVTKVAVSEHKVRVSTFDTLATTTKQIRESIDLEEGSTVRVSATSTATSTTSFTFTETKNDPEMNEWITENKDRDQAEDAIKRSGNGESIREGLKELLSPRTEETIQKEEIPTKGTETGTQKEPIKEPVQETRKEETKPSPTLSPTPIVKLDEEVFFDKFSVLFIQYFYLDEKDVPCGLQVTPAERVRVVTSFATQSGYAFSSNTLLSFAQEIDAYCKIKTPEAKTRLQARFDVEWPYQENI